MRRPSPLFPQDVDALVRDASVEALTAFAYAASERAGAALPGSSSANPYLRAVFECLGEQRKESQTAAGQALLQVGGRPRIVA